MSYHEASGEHRNIYECNFTGAFARYRRGSDLFPLLFRGDARRVLKEIPANSIDCVMTSPPYWGKREYDSGGIGLEKTWSEYISALEVVFKEVKRVLKPTGSFWLNMGDRYQNKSLIGIPWRIVLRLTDNQGWVLRNSVIWNKVKSGMDNSKDRLGNVHEHVFHLVKRSKGYYYDAEAIRSKPRSTKVKNGMVVSATGVSGVRYRRQIELSTSLTEDEKANAVAALEEALNAVRAGWLADFRMIIRGQQRATHSDRGRISGRAKELQQKGYYIMRYDPNGSKPADVWDILPEDTQNRALHFAPYPTDLCYIPILATSPLGGVVLDPFCGTGSTLLVASTLGRQSVGVDCSLMYLQHTEQRCSGLV